MDKYEQAVQVMQAHVDNLLNSEPYKLAIVALREKQKHSRRPAGVYEDINDEVEELKTALRCASEDCVDDCCPEGIYGVEWPECEGCPCHDAEIHTDTERDVRCWERYYTEKAKARLNECHT